MVQESLNKASHVKKVLKVTDVVKLCCCQETAISEETAQELAVLRFSLVGIKI